MVPLHVVWKLLIAASMAFFWAEDPSALRVPVGQSDAAVPVAAVPVFVASEPQAPRAKAPDIATMMMALLRVVITGVSLSQGQRDGLPRLDSVDSEATASSALRARP